MRKITLAIFGIFCFVMCSSQPKEVENEMVWVVMQPIAEVGQTLWFSVIFSNKADAPPQINDIDIEGLELSHSPITMRERDFHILSTYATPQRLGIIEIPSFSITIDSVEHTSRPFFINVVENVTIDENSVRTVLVLDRETYQLQDTIRMSLFQYSKFARANARAILKEEESFDIEDIDVMDITSIESTEEDTMHTPRLTFTVEELTGIANIEEFPDEELEWYDWLFHRLGDFGWRSNQRMATLNGRTYIKTELARFYFIANQKGTFRFEPSIFEFSIEKSVDDFFDRFTPNESGTWTVNPPQNRIIVTSNSVEIVVR